MMKFTLVAVAVLCYAPLISAQSFTCKVPSIANGYVEDEDDFVVANGSLVQERTLLRVRCRKGFTLPSGWQTMCLGPNSWWPRPGTCQPSTTAVNSTRKCLGFKCPGDDGFCIHSTNRCDRVFDCPQGEDEFSGCAVRSQALRSCTDDEFACSNGRCIRPYFRCNDRNDCGDSSDEQNCTSSSSSGTEASFNCSVGEFQCGDGACIDNTRVCDGMDDCGDAADERGCIRATGVICESFVCANDSSICIRNSFVCDGEVDCVDGSDEENCGSDKPPIPLPPLFDITEEPEVPYLSNETCGWWWSPTLGGDTATPGEFPWLTKVIIKFRNTDDLDSCEGALVAEQWILTAAHCVTDLKNATNAVEFVFVQLGRHNLLDRAEKGFDLKSSTILKHPNFDAGMNWNYDFALIKLSDPIAPTRAIRSACLPSDEMCAASDMCNRVIVAGWGQIEPFVRVAETTVNKTQECNSAYGFGLSGAQMCVGDGSPSNCRGASGSPLICKHRAHAFVIGVSSWGTDECGSHGAPSIFARVCSAMPWIKSTIAG